MAWHHDITITAAGAVNLHGISLLLLFLFHHEVVSSYIYITPESKSSALEVIQMVVGTQRKAAFLAVALTDKHQRVASPGV